MSISEPQWESSGTTQAGFDKSNGQAAVLEKVLSGDNQDTVVAELVSYLQGTSYSISDLLCDAASLKKKIASAHASVEQVIDGWSVIDRTVGSCLALTSIAHEKFIEQTLHAFCEFDQSGVITYANAKMRELAPGCIGHDISGYFGKIANEIRATLNTGGPRRLYQMDLNANGRSRPVLAEFGTIESNAHSSRYALLVDLSEQVESEQKTLEAAPYGMLKLDGKHRILYANRKAVEMFGGPLERLLGQDARRFITNRDSLREVLRQNLQRRKGRGGQCEILFTKPISGDSVHLRISSIPLFDACGSVTGTLTALEPIDHEIGRAHISRLIAKETDYNKLFAELMRIVARFVPFDWANLSLRTEGGDYSLTICNYPEPKTPYYTRWFAIPESYRNWLDRPQTWVDDLAPYLSETSEGQALLQNPDTKRYLDDGLRSIFAVPVRASGRIIGSLSLMSKQRALYGEETKETLTRLALDQALHAVFNARERAEQDFISALVRDISTVTNHKALAQTVVDQIANFYGFGHVSIFKVNALRGRFSILAQARGRPDGVTLPDEYTQALDSGLLGRARLQQQPVILKDVNDGSEEAQQFVRVATRTTSELCVPIKLRGRVLWILNLEDQQSNAFTAVEIQTIGRIIGQIEKTLESLFKSLVLDQVLEVFPEAIAIMELNGKILDCNQAALRMFELESLTGHEDIWTLLPDATWLARPAEGNFVTEKATVVGAIGKKTPVLAWKFTLPEEYDHFVLKLQDVSALQWQTDLERLKAALAETASQVRVPLSLVSTFVQQIGKKVQERGLREVVQKAVNQLSRIELTYDRVLAAYGKLPRDPKQVQAADATLPPTQGYEINIRDLLHHIISELPALNRRAVKLCFDEGNAVIWGDPYRLLFALTSMLAYLLRSRANTGSIKIKVQRVDSMLEISMSGPVQPATPCGELESLIEKTRTEIALGDDVLERIAKEFHGVFERHSQPTGRERLLLRITAATRPAANIFN